jgi:GT2 family glycosyltransferase
MELESGMLKLMVDRMIQDNTIGICTCKMRRITENGEKLNIIDSVGANLDIFGFPCSRGINEIDKGQLDYFTDVFFSFGGAMLIKNNVFEQTGGYDPQTFTLGDDIDLSWRTHLLGYRVVVEPKACLYHRVSATLGNIYGRSHKRFLSEKNNIRTILKNYSLISLFLILPFYFLMLFGEIMFFLILGKLPLARSGIKAIGQTFKDFPGILARRKIIQSQRKVNDLEIFKLLKKKSYKISIFFDFVKNRGKGKNWDNYFGEKDS